MKIYVKDELKTQVSSSLLYFSMYLSPVFFFPTCLFHPHVVCLIFFILSSPAFFHLFKVFLPAFSMLYFTSISILSLQGFFLKTLGRDVVCLLFVEDILSFIICNSQTVYAFYGMEASLLHNSDTHDLLDCDCG